MKWMLLILVLDTADSSKPLHEDYQIYSTEAACDAAGQALQRSLELPNPNLRSISLCIPQSVFDPRPLDHGAADPKADVPLNSPP